MYEIELKAHVDNYKRTAQTIDTFAEFLGEISKKDTYWKLVKINEPSMQVRVRKEVKNQQESRFIVTYKQKETRKTKDNSIHFEVNSEKEFEISNREDFETILQDAKFTIALEKEKYVKQWKFNTVLIELCTIPPLGDFLELEILSELSDEKTVETCTNKLKDILLQAGLSLDDIEHRYYSEMLGTIHSLL